MTEQLTSRRIRVLIGGNIYAKRALVRRFLEDDGFDVAAEVMTREELLEAAADEPADAIVVDEELLPGSVDPLRERAPDARIVVFTAAVPGAPPMPHGADGYLEKGIGLASLTAMLNGLMSEAPPLDLTRTQPPPRAPQERRVLVGLGGVAAAIVALAVFALAVFDDLPSDVAPPSARPTSSPRSTTEPEPEGSSPLQLAFAELDEFRAALEAGSSSVAAIARSLIDASELAREAGYPLFSLDAELQALLTRVGRLDPALASTLRSILGSLFPDLVVDVQPGDGGQTPSDGDGPSAGTPDSGTIPTDDGNGGNPGNDNGGNGGNGDGFPGQGKHKGWEHKPPDGGWKGDNPKSRGNGKGHEQGKGKGPH